MACKTLRPGAVKCMRRTAASVLAANEANEKKKKRKRQTPAPPPTARINYSFILLLPVWIPIAQAYFKSETRIQCISNRTRITITEQWKLNVNSFRWDSFDILFGASVQVNRECRKIKWTFRHRTTTIMNLSVHMNICQLNANQVQNTSTEISIWSSVLLDLRFLFFTKHKSNYSIIHAHESTAKSLLKMGVATRANEGNSLRDRSKQRIVKVAH